MTSPIYSHPWIYERVMRLLYRDQYMPRIQSVATHIPEGSSIADICAGDCSLYRYGLKDRQVDYQGYDINPPFIRWANRKQIPMRPIDLRTDTIPPADCIVMLSALYQFIPNQREILDKLTASAKQKVILTEPIHNVAQSRIPFIGWAGKILTRIGDNPCADRFDEETLREFLTDYGFQTIIPIAKGRELLAVLTC